MGLRGLRVSDYGFAMLQVLSRLTYSTAAEDSVASAAGADEGSAAGGAGASAAGASAAVACETSALIRTISSSEGFGVGGLSSSLARARSISGSGVEVFRLSVSSCILGVGARELLIVASTGSVFDSETWGSSR